MLQQNLNLPENVLFEDFKNSEEECLEIIYRRYASTLFRYGIQFTSDESLVKDAIHDVFIKLYDNRLQLNIGDNIKFYLFACLKNHLYNLLKRELFFDKVNINDDEYIDSDAEEQVATALHQEELQREVQKVLDRLTDRQREIIYYRYIEEFSIEEISQLLDMNYQSVQNTIQRSIKRIRDSLPLALFFFILYKKVCFC